MLFYNQTKLIWFLLRRDRLNLPLWIIAVVTLGAGFAPLLPNMIGSANDMAILYETLQNPAMIAMCGKVYGTGPSFGTMFAQFMLVWSALLAAVMNIFIVVRHTRNDEEEGRIEVLRSLPVGKGAGLTALSVVLLLANLLIFLLTGALVAVCGVETITVAGSFLYGAAIAVIGLLFAGIAMLFAQLSATSKGTTGYSLAILGIFYLLRAAGDVNSEILALISPLGLVERTAVFADNKILPVIVVLLLSIAITAVAFALNISRSLGQGLIPARNGRIHASKFLSGEWGLALRLTRNGLIVWTVTVFVFSASYGSVFGDLEAFYSSNPLFQTLMNATDGTALIDPIVAMVMLIMAIVAVIPVAATVMRLHTEEKRGRLEQVFGKAISRVHMLIAYIVIAVVMTIVLQIVNGLGMWAAAYSSMESPPELGYMLKAALVYVPAMLAICGLGVLLLGWIPKFAGFVWFYIAFSFISVYIGALMNLPTWVMKLSVFGILGRWPATEFEIAPFIGLFIAFLALLTVGAVCYRRRDITG